MNMNDMLMFLQGSDKKLFFLINHGTANAFFDLLMPFLTVRGFLLFFPYILFILLRACTKGGGSEEKPDLKAALWAVLISFCSFVLTDWFVQEIKQVIGRIRPCNALDGVRLLVGCTQSFSMPSNHAANVFAAAVSLYYLTRKSVSRAGAGYLFLLAFLISYSRAYVGVHYPADILAGALFGAGIALLLILLYKRAVLRYKIQPYTTLLFAGLAAISLFRIYYISHGLLDLSPDEAHYWEWSRRPDLSYYSKGPMIAYLIYIGAAIFGDTVFGIRIPAVIFSVLSSVYLFKLAGLMYKDDAPATSGGELQEGIRGNPIGLSSALLYQIIPLFAPFGILFTIDAPFLFFWIFSLYLFWKAVQSEGPGESTRSGIWIWVLAGLSIGLGLLTKYTMAFFYLCGFLFLLRSEKRYLLKTWKPYVALAVGCLAFSPVVIWNMQHDWITVRHTAGQAHVAEGLKISLKSFLEFFGSQVGVITPVLFGMMFYALFKLQKGCRGVRSAFLFYFSVPVVAFFLLKSLQGKVQANWAMTGYITGIIALVRCFSGSSRAPGDGADALMCGNGVKLPAPRTSRLLYFLGIGLALFVTAVSHYPSLVNLPLRLDPSARLRGWKALGEEVGRIYESMPGTATGKGDVLIFSDSYQVASELAFYVKGHPKTYAINLGRRMNQYDLWPDINSGAREMKQGQGKLRTDTIDGIFVKIGEADIPPEVARSFGKFDRETFKAYEKGRVVREYSIFSLYGFKGMVMERPETF